MGGIYTAKVMLDSLLTGFIGGICAWFFTDFVTKPFRHFYDLRRDVTRCLVQYGNVGARARIIGNVREQMDLSPEENARLSEAQKAFRGLAADMRAFANVDYFANQLVSYFGFDANKIASALIGYSNEISTYGEGRQLYHDRVEKLLRIRSIE